MHYIVKDFMVSGKNTIVLSKNPVKPMKIELILNFKALLRCFLAQIYRTYDCKTVFMGEPV